MGKIYKVKSTRAEHFNKTRSQSELELYSVAETSPCQSSAVTTWPEIKLLG